MAGYFGSGSNHMLELFRTHLGDLAKDPPAFGFAQHPGERRILAEVVSIGRIVDERLLDLGDGSTQNLFPPVRMARIDAPLIAPAQQGVSSLIHHRLSEAPSHGLVIGETTRPAALVTRSAGAPRRIDPHTSCRVAVTDHGRRQGVASMAVGTIGLDRVIQVKERRHRYLHSTL